MELNSICFWLHLFVQSKKLMLFCKNSAEVISFLKRFKFPKGELHSLKTVYIIASENAIVFVKIMCITQKD